MKLAIVIPAYNEEKTIRKVIGALPRKIKGVEKISVIVVNDGSTDLTSVEISKTRAIQVSHPVNMGAGAATATGLEATKIIGANVAVTFDGDGQHDPKDIERVIAPILGNKADLVIGTRLVNPAGMPWYKQIGNRGLNFFTYLFSGYWSSDSQSGFKAFSKKALKKLSFEMIGYEFCSEIVMEAAGAKLQIKEVPIKVIYNPCSKKKGQSILNGANIISKIAFRRFTK